MFIYEGFYSPSSRDSIQTTAVDLKIGGEETRQSPDTIYHM
jgi:hypothetical protein